MTQTRQGSPGKALYVGLLAILSTSVLAVVALSVTDIKSAKALPSFARQTGQQCVSCHNGFPELTPYGRQFKLNGYTFSSGDAPSLPIAGLIIDSFTQTSKDLPGRVLPTTSRNNNLDLDAINLYFAGKITSNVGAFAQGLWSPLTRRSQLFTTDIRYADSTQLFGKDATFGVSVNNNPGVTDPWNTGQSFWSYPYENSHVLIPPLASTAVQGRYALQVIGATSYVSWNQWLYVAGGLYGKVDPSTLNSLGVNIRGLSPIDGVAPYWRVAVEPAWGHSTLELGTFGMALSSDPHLITTAGTDKTVDVGVDSEYQYLADRHSVSLMGSYIHEHTTLGASRALGFASNADDSLNAVNVKGTYTYDQTYGANLGYFRTTGSRDPLLYGAAANGRPDTSGWTGELDYYPFNRGGPSFWPTLNFKFGLQYTAYTRFDGGSTNYDGLGRRAGDNNTLFLYSWTIF
jgi:hypothetical protein